MAKIAIFKPEWMDGECEEILEADRRGQDQHGTADHAYISVRKGLKRHMNWFENKRDGVIKVSSGMLRNR